ncbi:MAG: hotdog fold thioesterase [Anditalea sp.]
MIFKKNVDLDFLNDLGKNTMVDFLGIKFTKVGADFLEATMPVNERTKQPLGLLHGGANVVLAETLGSIASTLVTDTEKQYCVGLEINANHLRPIKSGIVKGITKPIHLGKKTQVWEIKIFSEQEELTCISRITLAVLDKK